MSFALTYSDITAKAEEKIRFLLAQNEYLQANGVFIFWHSLTFGNWHQDDYDRLSSLVDDRPK